MTDPISEITQMQTAQSSLGAISSLFSSVGSVTDSMSQSFDNVDQTLIAGAGNSTGADPTQTNSPTDPNAVGN